MAKALELLGLSKAFDGNRVLHLASLEIEWGEVHALLGENGAGKSTIMNIANGVYAADAGEIRVDGRKVDISGPSDATSLGLGMVHQHFKLVKRFSVAENILLSCRRQLSITSVGEAALAVAAKGAEVGFPVKPDAVVGELSIAEQQRVEILKVLLLGAKIVILDEPTAVLTEEESGSVLSFVRNLALHGHAVVLITHKLREVIGYSDRVTVMRYGKTVLKGATANEQTAESLAMHMVGEHMPEIKPLKRQPGEERLVVERLSVSCLNGGVGVNQVNLSVRSGEILGIAGVGGNGQQELMDCLTGLRACSEGIIRLNGRNVTFASVAIRRNGGLRAIPSDRFGSGLVGNMPVFENLGMTRTTSGHYGRGIFFSRARMRQEAEKALAEYGILGATPITPTRLLSGGNAQKLLLARELEEGASILVAHSPTRGLDVRACNAVHTTIRDAVERGAACLLISEDLEEILGLSTRVAVMSHGRIVGEFSVGEATREVIGKLMLGHA